MLPTSPVYRPGPEDEKVIREFVEAHSKSKAVSQRATATQSTLSAWQPQSERVPVMFEPPTGGLRHRKGDRTRLVISDSGAEDEKGKSKGRKR